MEDGDSDGIPIGWYNSLKFTVQLTRNSCIPVPPSPLRLSCRLNMSEPNLLSHFGRSLSDTSQISQSEDTVSSNLTYPSSSIRENPAKHVFETSPVNKTYFGYRTDSDRGIASSLKDLFERFESAQFCGSSQGEWKSFNSREEATNWAFGKEASPAHSIASEQALSFERKAKTLSETSSGSGPFGYATLYANDEKWSNLTNGEPNWGSAKTLFVDADGACPKNGRRGALGGIGVYFGPNDKRNVSEPLPGHPQTNQRAELMSLIRAVEILRGEGKRVTPVVLRSDSRYAVSGLTEWVPKWKRNGWTTARGTEVKNQDLWRTLDAEIAHLGSLRKVHLVWVKAHAGDHRNEEADRLATEGVRKAESMRQRLMSSLPCLPGSGVSHHGAVGTATRRPAMPLNSMKGLREPLFMVDNKPTITLGSSLTKRPSSLYPFDNKIARHPVW